MPFDVKDQITIVTGSAQGFGKEFAERLLKRGAKVCLSDVNKEAGEKTLEEFKECFGNKVVTFKSCDVAKEDDWEQLWAHTESAFGGKVTLLVNNAGVNPKHGWTACINIMLTGVGYGTFLAIEKMGKSKGGSGGRIVNISSMAGFTTRDLEVAGYTAAKTGVIALTRSFETSIPNVFSTEGIKAYALCPFFANTVLLTDRISITDIEKKFNKRVLTVSEVGHGFEESLKIDQNGGCVILYPDVAPFLMPDNGNKIILMAMIAFGQIVGGPMSFSTFDIKHVLISGLILVALFYMMICVLF